MQLGTIALVAIAVIAVVAIVVALFQWLWNITMPDVFGLKTITYWQAFRLILIASILLGGRWEEQRWPRANDEGTPAVQVSTPRTATASPVVTFSSPVSVQTAAASATSSAWAGI